MEQLPAAVLHQPQKCDGFDDLFHPPRLSKPEMHLLLKPFFLLDRHADRFKPIEYVYSVVESGKAIKRSWMVQPHFKYGLPGAFDRDVTTVIYELVNEKYFSKGLPVEETMTIGTLREFTARMGLNASGPNIAAVKDSLKRLMNTLAACEDTFFDNKKHRYVSVSFRLLASVGFVGEEDGKGGSFEENFVAFDQHILRNLNTGYVMVIDVDRLRVLKTNIAKQLYSHLAYRFFVEAIDGTDVWVADYDWLSIHLGVKRWSELWRAKQQFHDAHEELKSLGYISSYEWEGWRILYRPGPVWKGEQLRRKTGKSRAKQRGSRILQKQKHDQPEPIDPLMPALAAFVSGLPSGAERIAALGLTEDQARKLWSDRL